MRRGFSLLEILVAVGIFMTLVLLAFVIFEYGVRATQRASNSSSLQTAATRTMLTLQNDLRRSSRGSVSVVKRKDVTGRYQRDLLCLAGMSDWNSATAFNPTYGTPNFDRYLVYYATPETPTGRAIRSVYNGFPAPPNGMAPPMTGFGLNKCQDDPATNPGPTLNPGQQGYSTLSPNVREFSVVELPDSRILATLTLFQVGVKAPSQGARRMDQSFQMEVEVYPQNTWPRD